MGQVGDHKVVHGGGPVGAPEVHEQDATLELRAVLVAHRDRVDARVGVVRHLDVVDPAVRRRELVLHAALQPEPLDLDAMRGLRDLVTSPPDGQQVVERADHRHCDGGGGARCATGRDTRRNRELDRDVVGDPRLVGDRGQQPVALGHLAPRAQHEPLAEVDGVHHEGVRSCRPWIRGGADRDARSNGDAADVTVVGEPRVGPATDVAHTHRRGRVHDEGRNDGIA